MSALIEVGLTNAAIATVLAMVVFAITRFWRQPHVAHVLWLLVLVKLITPPLVRLPIQWPAVSDEPKQTIASEPKLNPGKSPATNQVPLVPATELTEAPASTAPATMSPETLPESAEVNDASASTPVAPATPSDLRLSSIPWTGWVAAVWLVGSFGWITIAARRIVRFQRLLHRAEPFSVALEGLALEVASKLGLHRRPGLRIVDAQLPPLVWPLGRRPTVVLPRSVAAALDAEQIKAVLAHELAHVVRRDHWVRWFELVVGALYWWHPVVWLARRELQTAEESCCDALVLARLSTEPRTYGRALVEVAELLATANHSSPVLASGLGTRPRLERRIESLVAGRLTRPLSKFCKLALVCVALLVLPLSAGLGQSQPAEAKADETAPASTDEPTSEPADVAESDVPRPTVSPYLDLIRDQTSDARTISRRVIKVPPATYKIAPGDVLEIQVDGTLVDRPIDGDYVVEPAGTVGLGVPYSRTKVAGLTLEEAEKAIQEHLSTKLQSPIVFVTLGGWRNALDNALTTSVGARHARDGKEALRYQGKSFDEWQRILTTELYAAERENAVNALAHFADHGYGNEIGELFGNLLLHSRPYELNDDMVREITATISTFGAPGTDVLVEVLEQQPWYARYAIQALQTMGEAAQSAVPAIIKTAKDGRERGAAYAALGEIGVRNDAVIALLTEGLSDMELISGWLQTKYAAALALSKLGTPADAEPATDALIELLRDDLAVNTYPLYRLAAIDGLAKIGPPASKAIPVLRELHSNPPHLGNSPLETERVTKEFQDRVAAAIESIERPSHDEP